MAEADFRSVGVRECGERAVVVKGRASSAERGLLFGRFGTAIVSADGGIGISDLVFRKMMLHLFETNRIQKNKRMKKYRCTVCEWIYDPAVGDPDGGVPQERPVRGYSRRLGVPFVRCRQRPVRAGRGVSPPLSKKDETQQARRLAAVVFLPMLRRLGAVTILTTNIERFGNIAEFS